MFLSVSELQQRALREEEEVDSGCWHCGSKDMPREDSFCRPCLERYGYHMLKAATDPFDYAMRLTSGDLIYFQQLEIHGDWVTIGGGQINWEHSNYAPVVATENPPWERGLQIRIDAIAWIADAPYGS
jgi:hypothetical protein